MDGHDDQSQQLPCSSIIAEQPDNFPRPGIVDSHIVTLRDLTSWCHEIAQSIFRTLSKALELPPEVALETLHNPTASYDITRLLRYEENTLPDTLLVPQAAHTDLGSLTFLFTEINLGDAMSMWTEGALQSVLHRVASMPGQEIHERYSFALLMRPTNTAPMCSLLHEAVPNGQLCCEEWISAKLKALGGGEKGGDSVRSECRDAEIRIGRLATV
ncbi:oxidoreductase 2OG-Fe(II) oxygenase family [Penicillium malachiteum]|uniref:oxidoreductase 2OG-Fe(II) oxygenase family n=1 Tax=Penicillium malachiteum TaxID=1324776 RepID=UPI0025489697|nr:oxidoreductase 2OG-Fe(II) oxygenase family [Penicillium malachiteum]KAJ5715031.1 oxidoreductase 2OG-Fe(II) oxygenase family [Penicillium malachiteum]